jgi:hypothetical protein
MGAAGNLRLMIKAVDAWLIANISQGLSSFTAYHVTSSAIRMHH